jgi:hypothetical protein
MKLVVVANRSGRVISAGPKRTYRSESVAGLTVGVVAGRGQRVEEVDLPDGITSTALHVVLSDYRLKLTAEGYELMQQKKDYGYRTTRKPRS